MGQHLTQKISGRWLLASDLDGTLIPTDGKAGVKAIRRFIVLVESAQLRLAYVTGRHLDLALAGIERFELPMPDAMATDVGTRLYWRREGGFVPDTEYEEFVASRPGTPEAATIRAALDGIDGLRLQESVKQSRFKVSYYYTGMFSPGVLRILEGRLSGIGHTRLVRSRDPATGVGLLDVLPRGVGKETAVEFLESRFEGGNAGIVFAGDSGNDLAALLAGYRAIVVGNAPAPLKGELRHRAAKYGLEERVFFADASYADGVIEGLEHYGVLASG